MSVMPFPMSLRDQVRGNHAPVRAPGAAMAHAGPFTITQQPIYVIGPDGEIATVPQDTLVFSGVRDGWRCATRAEVEQRLLPIVDESADQADDDGGAAA